MHQLLGLILTAGYLILVVLLEAFIVAATIYFSEEPSQYHAGNPLYEASISLATGLSLVAALGTS